MATCLKDGTDLGEDFGMVTCPVCSTVYFIDASGELIISSEPEMQTPEPDSPVNEAPVEFEPVLVDPSVSFDMGSEPPIDVHADDVLETPEPLPSNEPLSFEPVQLEPQDEGLAAASVPQFETGPKPGDPLGIQDYIQSEVSQAKGGPLLFRLFVSGIDTKEIRQSLREAMSDPRFAWDVDGILARIKNGELRLDDVPPVKASILVNRIKRLPVHIRWEQYDIKEAEI